MITVERLTKRYGPFTALDDVSFEVRPGEVTGFLGPNGAGKTTAMRVMAGLTPATSGSATVLGTSYARINNPGRRVGLLLDASAQHAGRTGREVLSLGAMVMGVDRSRVEEMTTLVGLTDKEAGRRVRNYSLGMRQRLGIAHALLGDPEVLILDEPANGLDPAGIRWMRDLLRGYADRGGTVLLSSHLLNEIERVADEIIVIGGGRIVARGTKDELVASAGTVVRSTDDESLRRALVATSVEVRTAASGGLVVDIEPRAVGRIAHDAGIPLTELRAGDGRGLEEIFLDLTAESAREGVVA
ncbi:MAG: ATP-binding cassette domain-containing protein [Ornithinibacter sp.]